MLYARWGRHRKRRPHDRLVPVLREPTTKEWRSMIEIRRILCPIDFSEFSRRAFDHAVAIAKWYESTITLLHVLPAPIPIVYAPGPAPVPTAVVTREDRNQLLLEMNRFAEGEAGSHVSLEFSISEGNSADGILATATSMTADLIVMGTHGRSGFERLVLGSVTEKVLRKATCPVLSVPRRMPDVVPAPGVLFKRILCAIDFSDCSMRALNYAMSLAQQADAHLTVVHVIEVPSEAPADFHETGFGDLRGPQTLAEYITAAEQERRARLADAVPDAVRAYCTIETVVAAGKPYREILRIASEQHSELIVMGIHGRGAADRLFFGSTTQHVVRQASCPVLTLRTA
jgi:nucleotide-binding universal stress UspA family protein